MTTKPKVDIPLIAVVVLVFLVMFFAIPTALFYAGYSQATNEYKQKECETLDLDYDPDIGDCYMVIPAPNTSKD